MIPEKVLYKLIKSGYDIEPVKDSIADDDVKRIKKIRKTIKHSRKTFKEIQDATCLGFTQLRRLLSQYVDSEWSKQTIKNKMNRDVACYTAIKKGKR